MASDASLRVKLQACEDSLRLALRREYALEERIRLLHQEAEDLKLREARSRDAVIQHQAAVRDADERVRTLESVIAEVRKEGRAALAEARRKCRSDLAAKEASNRGLQKTVDLLRLEVASLTAEAVELRAGAIEAARALGAAHLAVPAPVEGTDA